MLLAQRRLRAAAAAGARAPPPARARAAAVRASSPPPPSDAPAQAAPTTTTTRRASLLASLAAAAAAAPLSSLFALPGAARAAPSKGAEEGALRVGAKFVHSEEEWRQILEETARATTAAAGAGGGSSRGEPGVDFRYKVLRRAATERPLSSALYTEKRKGAYVCAGCGSPVYRSDAKYNSGSGWPSFFEAVDGAVERARDDSIPFMVREELRCAACAGHLGHVFDDGPAPTYERHCINGAALRFRPDDPSELRPGDDDGRALLAAVSRMVAPKSA